MAEEKKKEEAGEEGAETAAPARPNSNRKKLMIVIGAVAGSMLLIGTPIYFLAARGSDKPDVGALSVTAPDGLPQPEQPVIEGQDDEDELDDGEEALGTIFPMEGLVVNLGSKGSYLRCQVQFEFEGLDVPHRFYAKLVPIRENVIRILSSRRPEEVLSWAGKEALKDEIRAMVNDMLRKKMVRKVYFTQFVVQ